MHFKFFFSNIQCVVVIGEKEEMKGIHFAKQKIIKL
jgi:hypothetical protein